MKILNKLIEIKSFDMFDNSEIIEYLTEQFKPFSKEILKIKNPNSNIFNLIIGLNTEIRNTEAIILSGHIDTVTADESAYQTNPFTATLKDNKLYGLGVIDMKCFFASILDNIDKIKSISTPIIISITGDEETNLLGIEEVVKTLKQRNVNPILSIIGEPTQLKICTKSKSCFEYMVEVNGKSCHSSNPSNGINACYILAKLINKIEKLNKNNSNTTLNCGIINGGEKINIVPCFASMNFDIRSDSQFGKATALNKIKKFINKMQKQYPGCKITLKNTLSIPALEQKTNNLISQLTKTLNLQESEFIGGCEAGYYQELGGEAFLFGAGDLALAHKPNEFLNLADYQTYNQLLISLLQNANKIQNNSN